jgi:hypothetical protein
LLAGNVVMNSSQPSYADGSWADLLKPLVKDVIVPGASMGMKKLTQHMQKKQADGQTSTDPNVMNVTSDGSTSWTDAFTSATSNTTSTTSTNSGDPFSMPEEPMSTSSSEAGMNSKPEEPMNMSYAAPTSDIEPPPPPPPPVNTP